MKNGRYDLCFSADGYNGRGHLVVDGKTVSGGDGQYRLEGSLQDGRQHITASFNVSMDPSIVRNARMPSQYSVQMSGTATDDDFTLIGIGPLGLIVEINGSYAGTST